jgi:hypothetical protein
MPIDELATNVINAIQGKPEAVKHISDALASGDAVKIREAIKAHAGIDISEEDAQGIADQITANPSAAAAYNT